MPKKIRVGILYGGKSIEYDISLLSAKNVVAALDRSKYVPVLLKIDRRGRFAVAPQIITLTREQFREECRLSTSRL